MNRMHSHSAGATRWRPTPVRLIAGALVILGIALPAFAGGAAWWFFALTALGAFGPGILRELGWLHDQDEFQRRAAQRAGYHAYLATGVVAVLVYAYTRSGDRAFRAPGELTSLYLCLLWFTWVFSSLLSYWGACRTAQRVLIAFGVGWGAFNVAANFGHPATLAMQLLVTTAPFFLAAWIAARWPRPAGALLLAAAAAFTWLLWGHGLAGGQPLLVRSGVSVMFIGPVLLSGLALLRQGGDAGEGPAAAPTA